MSTLFLLPGLTRARVAGLIAISLFAGTAWKSRAAQPVEAVADVALIVSVDVSESVDDARYQLQMDGIAAALEDPSVIATFTSGPKGRVLLAMVVWADKSELAVPWVQISNTAEAVAVADRVRHLKRYGGEFTCMARMFQNLRESVIADLPMKASRVVVDVSGDGVDNCSSYDAMGETHDALIKSGVTINGLPIVEDHERIVGAGAYRAPGNSMEYLRRLEAEEQLTLEQWYGKYVMGGEFAFILPANGYSDFARAMRQKFVTEISADDPGRRPPHGRPHRIAQR